MNAFQKRPLVVLSTTLLCLFLFNGCNTMRGLGQDTEKVGQEIQEKATR
jgi:predicted small secreted protein